MSGFSARPVRACVSAGRQSTYISLRLRYLCKPIINWDLVSQTNFSFEWPKSQFRVESIAVDDSKSFVNHESSILDFQVWSLNSISIYEAESPESGSSCGTFRVCRANAIISKALVCHPMKARQI